MASRMNPENKNHWYDGLFYDLFIAPHQDRAFLHVREFIADGSTLLDVGCGTGRLVFQLADKCDRIDGIDPSAKNIDIARRKVTAKPSDKVRFHHTDALAFLAESDLRFDYVTMSYVIHEIDESERITLLHTLSAVAHKIIMVDYLVPQTRGHWRILNEAVEFVAGSSHYRNFKSFMAGNGLTGVLDRAGLKILRELRNDPPSSHIVLAAGESGQAKE
jgi:2-polyprenyl-3-methyl-5-hydroxy-6-metoxy-1,4-benzoquinol methylase